MLVRQGAEAGALSRALIAASSTLRNVESKLSAGHAAAHALGNLDRRWGVIVAGPAGWFWIAQPGGHTVAWPITTAVAVAAFLPLGWVGERLVRAAAR